MTSKTEKYLWEIGSAGDAVRTDLIVSITSLEEGVEILLSSNQYLMQHRCVTIHATFHTMVNYEEKKMLPSSSIKHTTIFSHWDTL